MATTTSILTENEPQIQHTVCVEVDKSEGKNFFDDVHFLGDKDGKVNIRSPPKFSNKLDEVKYQKQYLAAAFRVFAKQGFDEGVAGHISLRDPINPGKSARKPSFPPFCQNRLTRRNAQSTSGSTRSARTSP